MYRMLRDARTCHVVVAFLRIATRTTINRVMWTRLLFADVAINRMEIIFAKRLPPAESGEKILLGRFKELIAFRVLQLARTSSEHSE